MIDGLIELLRRQSSSLAQLEARLRALELVVASDEQRFLSLALEELEAASEQLAGLELARALGLSAAGLPVDATGSELVSAVRGDDASLLADVIEDLVAAMRRTADARERAVAIVSRSGGESRTRLAAASAFSAVS